MYIPPSQGRPTGVNTPYQRGTLGGFDIVARGSIGIGSDNIMDHFVNAAYANAIARCKGRTKQLEEYLNAFVADPTKL